MDNREALIKGLSESFMMSDDARQSAEQKRFNIDTNTLVHGGQAVTAAPEAMQIRGIERYDVTVDPETFVRIASGRQNFIIMEQKGQRMGDSIYIREIENLKATGNACLKEIKVVMEKERGLREGFVILIYE